MQKLVRLNCPICNSNNFSIYYSNIRHTCNIQKTLQINDSEMECVDINQCNNCGHHYLSMVFNDNLMKKYYNVINSEYYSLNGKIENNLEFENIRNANFLTQFKTKGKVLEIGCGYGFLLEELKKRGFEVYGIEPSPHASKFAMQKLELNIHNGFLSEDLYQKESFDCIILFDVVEHIYNMNQLMTLITPLLKSGGSLLIGTGNIKSTYAKFSGKNWWYLSSWEHISFFSKKSVYHLLRQFQYSEICIKNISHRNSIFFNIGIVAKTVVKKIINLFIVEKLTFNVAFDHFLIHAIKK